MTTLAHPRFPHLFSPFTLKGVELRNRVVISGHFAGWWVGDGGLPSDAFVAYVEERAKGGVGLFVIGATSPQRGSGWLENVGDDIVPRYRALVDAGHRHGTAVFAQLCHPGFKPLPGTPIIEPPPHASPPPQPATAPTAPAAPVDAEPRRHVPSRGGVHRPVSAFAAAGDAAGPGSLR